jgi:hypothetical protein
MSEDLTGVAGLPAPLLPPGWYPDPSSRAHERYWSGSEWMPSTRPAPRMPDATKGDVEDDVDEAPSWAVPALVMALALAVVGGALQFKSVSLASGDDLLWVGAALAAVGGALAFVGHARSPLKVLTICIVAFCVWNVWQTEKQLQEKRDQIQQIVGSISGG